MLFCSLSISLIKGLPIETPSVKHKQSYKTEVKITENLKSKNKINK